MAHRFRDKVNAQRRQELQKELKGKEEALGEGKSRMQMFEGHIPTAKAKPKATSKLFVKP